MSVHRSIVGAGEAEIVMNVTRSLGLTLQVGSYLGTLFAKDKYESMSVLAKASVSKLLSGNTLRHHPVTIVNAMYTHPYSRRFSLRVLREPLYNFPSHLLPPGGPCCIKASAT